jgi:CheY-like chemotaxis protein
VQTPEPPETLAHSIPGTFLPYDLMVIVLDPGQLAGVSSVLPLRDESVPGPRPFRVLCIPSHASTPEEGSPATRFDAVLSVPFSRAALRRAIERLLSPPGQPTPEPNARAESLGKLELSLSNQKMRILVVDDNDMNLMVTAKILRKMGHRVSTATDGFQALDIHQKFPFDLVLMDCQMPNMDGFEATRRIRSLSGPLARTPIVALTGNTSPQDMKRCLDSGMNDFLAKPVHAIDLRTMIEKWSPANRQVNPPPTTSE